MVVVRGQSLPESPKNLEGLAHQSRTLLIWLKPPLRRGRPAVRDGGILDVLHLVYSASVGSSSCKGWLHSRACHQSRHTTCRVDLRPVLGGVPTTRAGCLRRRPWLGSHLEGRGQRKGLPRPDPAARGDESARTNVHHDGDLGGGLGAQLQGGQRIRD